MLDIAEILNDVIRHTVRQHNKDKGRVEWRVLIVDQQSMRMVSACTKMQGWMTKPSRDSDHFPYWVTRLLGNNLLVT